MSRRGSLSSTPTTTNKTLSPSTSPSTSRRNSTGNVAYKPSSRSSSPSPSPTRVPTSGEYDMSLIGGAPLTITMAASGVTPIVPGPPVKSGGASNSTTVPRRRPTPQRATASPSPTPISVPTTSSNSTANQPPPSPTHKKLSARPPVDHTSADLLRSWRRDDTRSPSPSSQHTRDDSITTKLPPREQKMTNINYTRGRRGSIDDIVISHHTDESVTNVEIATSPVKKNQNQNDKYEWNVIPASPPPTTSNNIGTTRQTSQPVTSMTSPDKSIGTHTRQSSQPSSLSSTSTSTSTSPPNKLSPSKRQEQPTIDMSSAIHRPITRSSSGTKSAGSSPYIGATAPGRSGVSSSALLLHPSSSSSSSSSSPRVRWLLRLLILTSLLGAICSYLSRHSPIIVFTWLLFIPFTLYIVTQYQLTNYIELPHAHIINNHKNHDNNRLTQSPLMKSKGEHKGRRRSSLPGLQTFSSRSATTPTSTSTSTSFSTSTTPSHDIPNVLLARKTPTSNNTTTTIDEKPRTKLPTNVFHT